MRTNERLNWGFFWGSVTTAALVGVLTRSCGVFFIALLILLALNVANHEIRGPRGR